MARRKDLSAKQLIKNLKWKVDHLEKEIQELEDQIKTAKFAELYLDQCLEQQNADR